MTNEDAAGLTDMDAAQAMRVLELLRMHLVNERRGLVRASSPSWVLLDINAERLQALDLALDALRRSHR